MAQRLPSSIALQCLEHSERLGSFTRAGRVLNLTQGAVSRQVIGLEKRLGVQLLRRTRESLIATPAGQAYLAEVRPLLHRLERATVDIALHQGRGGSLNLSAPSSFCNYWLAPRLTSFVSAHPHVTLNLSTYLGPVDFSAKRLDAAVMVIGEAPAGLQSILIERIVVRPYASAAMASRLEGQDFIAVLQHAPAALKLIHNSSLPHAWEGWLRQAGAKADTLANVPSGPNYDLLSMSLHAATAGIGIALLPEFMAAEACAAGQLVCLSPVAWTADRAYYLCFPEHSADLPALQQFSRWLRAAA